MATGTLPDDVIAYYYMPTAIIKIAAVAKAKEIHPQSTREYLLHQPISESIKNRVKTRYDKSQITVSI